MRQDDVTSVDEMPATDAIRHARGPRDMDDARRLFREYADWLKVDLCFQDFERELATLPGAYAPPRGRLLLVGAPTKAFGCIALRPLASECGCAEKGPGSILPNHAATLLRRQRSSLAPFPGGQASAATQIEPDPSSFSSSSSLSGEVKRLYVQPAHRGEHWGERLAREIVREARSIGYRELKLDTLAWMKEARTLYARLGFRECAPYYDNPLDGAVYMSLAL